MKDNFYSLVIFSQPELNFIFKYDKFIELEKIMNSFMAIQVIDLTGNYSMIRHVMPQFPIRDYSGISL